MSYRPRILTIGDTSGIHFIARQLSLLSKELDLFCCSLYLHAKNDWAVGDSKTEFAISQPVYKFIEDLKRTHPKDQKFDMVFLACRSFPYLRRCLNYLKEFLKPDSVILVDGGLGVSFEVVVHENLPDLTALCFFCDFDVKYLGEKGFSMQSENGKVTIGYSVSPRLKHDGIEVEKYLKLAHSFLGSDDTVPNKVFSLLQNSKSHIHFSKADDNGEFISQLLFNSIMLIAGDIHSFAFDEFDFQKISSDKALRPIFKGLVVELVYIALNIGTEDFRVFLKRAYNDTTIELFAKEIGKRYPNNATPFDTDLYFLDFPKLQFDLFHNLENYSFIILFQAILISDRLSIPNSTLTFLYGLLVKISGNLIEPLPPLSRRAADDRPAADSADYHSVISDEVDIQEDQSSSGVDRDLAKLFIRSEDLPWGNSSRLQTAADSEQGKIPLSKIGLNPSEYPYEIEDRFNFDVDFSATVFVGDESDISTASTRTEEGMYTILNEVVLREFKMPEDHTLEKFRTKPSHPTGSAKPFRKKQSLYFKAKRKFSPLHLQRAEWLNYKDYNDRHQSVFDTIAGTYEIHNKDRYSYVASSSKSSTYLDG